MNNLEMKLTPETIEVIVRLHIMFAGDVIDPQEIYDWMTKKNPGLGNISPLMLINRGRAHRVLHFIQTGDL